MVTSKRKQLGLALLVISAGVAAVLYFLGIPLFSAEAQNVSNSPNSVALSGHLSFHWLTVLLLVTALVGLVLSLSSKRGVPRA